MKPEELKYPYTLPLLPYKDDKGEVSYDRLDQFVDAETMKLHHTKHHQAYVDKLNAALKDRPDLQGRNLIDLLENFEGLPKEVQTPIRNHGGGHINHSMFWQMMRSGLAGKFPAPAPETEIAKKIVEKFGSFDEFKNKFTQVATDRLGSGWAWLVKNSVGDIEVYSTPNQDSPMMGKLIPLLGLDVWEHAYYLHYQNRRAAYIDNFWVVVNWEDVEKRFTDPNYI